MANQLLTIEHIKRELLLRFENNIIMAKYVLRNVDDDFAVKGRKIGDHVDCRIPPRFKRTAGEGLVLQDVVEEKVTVTLDLFFHVGFEFSNVDLALSVDDFGSRYLESAAQTLANGIDLDILALYKQIPNFVGTPASTPTANSTYLEANARLTEGGCPVGSMNRFSVVNPAMSAGIVNTNGAGNAFFHPQQEIEKQYRDGMMGRALGAGWSEDPNVAVHTVGALGGTPLVVGANQTGNSIDTDGWSNSITGLLLEGDIITFAGVNKVNPLNYQSTGRLQQFVVTADVNSDGSGLATIPISPSLTPSGNRQTVTGSPANDAIILIFGHASTHADAVTPQALWFHRHALILAMARQEDPRGTDMTGSVADKKSGIAFQVIRDYDINTNRTICRVNVLYGVKVLNSNFACRVVG